MRLNLIINGVLIGSANLDAARCKDEFYLNAIKRLLVLQNQDVLMLIPGKPVFDIELPAENSSSFFSPKEDILQLLNNYEGVTGYNNYKQSNKLSSRSA